MNKLKILIVEDHPFQRMILSRMIASLGHSVDIIKTGDEAVQKADDSYALIFMDIGLSEGELDGIEATKLIRGKGVQSVIVTLSAHLTEPIIKKCLDAGMNDILFKPLDEKKFNGVLKKFNLGPARQQSHESL